MLAVSQLYLHVAGNVSGILIIHMLLFWMMASCFSLVLLSYCVCPCAERASLGARDGWVDGWMDRGMGGWIERVVGGRVD